MCHIQIIGKIMVWSLSRVFNDALVEITITLAGSFITFYIAEQFLHSSGAPYCWGLVWVRSIQPAPVFSLSTGHGSRFITVAISPVLSQHVRAGAGGMIHRHFLAVQ